MTGPVKRWIYRRLGWETFEEAYARILAENPLEEQLWRIKDREDMIRRYREEKRQRLDGPNGEYQRGIEGLQ